MIDTAMPKPALERLEVVGELALDPFKISQPWTIGELVEHPGGKQVRDVQFPGRIDISRSHGSTSC
jgi:hypothetical protein